MGGREGVREGRKEGRRERKRKRERGGPACHCTVGVSPGATEKHAGGCYGRLSVTRTRNKHSSSQNKQTKMFANNQLVRVCVCVYMRQNCLKRPWPGGGESLHRNVHTHTHTRTHIN